MYDIKILIQDFKTLGWDSYINELIICGNLGKDIAEFVKRTALKQAEQMLTRALKGRPKRVYPMKTRIDKTEFQFYGENDMPIPGVLSHNLPEGTPADLLCPPEYSAKSKKGKLFCEDTLIPRKKNNEEKE